MKTPRLRWTTASLLCLIFVSVFACKNDPIEAPLAEPAETPIQDLWFQDLLSFLGRMHEALDDPSTRVEVRLRLLAGDETSAWKGLGIASEELFGLLLRMEQGRAGLEARWPDLREHTAYGGESDYPAELIERLTDDAWPDLPHHVAKPPTEFVCAALELYDNLSRCSSWNAFAQAFCMYHAYLRYLQHLSLGCGA